MESRTAPSSVTTLFSWRKASVLAFVSSRMSSRSIENCSCPPYSPTITVVTPIGNTNSHPARPGTLGLGANGSLLNFVWRMATRFVVSGSCLSPFGASARVNSMR